MQVFAMYEETESRIEQLYADLATTVINPRLDIRTYALLPSISVAEVSRFPTAMPETVKNQLSRVSLGYPQCYWRKHRFYGEDDAERCEHYYRLLENVFADRYVGNLGADHDATYDRTDQEGLAGFCSPDVARGYVGVPGSLSSSSTFCGKTQRYALARLGGLRGLGSSGAKDLAGETTRELP